MPNIVKGYEGVIRVWYVPTIATITAPTQTEVRAGTDITPSLTRDGFAPGVTNNKIDTSGLATTIDTQAMGTQGSSMSLKMRAFFPTDAIRALLGHFGVTGYLVVARGGFTSGNTPTTGDKVNVYPIQTGNPGDANSAQNTLQTWMLDVAITDPGTQYDIAIA